MNKIIALALELENTMLIIDEIKGRNVARSYNIEIIGTIGILLLAHDKGYIEDFLGTIQKLVDNGFRLSDSLFEKLRNKHGRK